MPLLGKIVVIKRNGTDGTDFPLTASCLFGRKLDCDIRIQLPQVSKEHCRIELNENKELILTNLSSVNPTRINGEILQQSERLKHGDLITIIDRSFRFEYPPAPTPKKKRLSTPGKGETVKVLQDQQVKSTPGTTEKKSSSEHIAETCLKDGSNLPFCLDQSVRDEQNKSTDATLSPFSDLYNMVKRNLATKPVWKSSNLSNTPLSRPPAAKQDLEKVSSENEKPATPKSSQKKRRSSTAKPVEGDQTESVSAQVRTATPAVRAEQKRRSESTETPRSQKKTQQTTPQKFIADQVAQQIAFESPSAKSPKGRRRTSSGGARQVPESQDPSQNPSEPEGDEEDKAAEAKQATRTSPRASAGKRLQVQDVQEVLVTPMCVDEDNDQTSTKKHKCDDLPLPAPKRKRVSFGGQLSPELFDKRLPPNSPLRRGATPGRRSLGFSQKSHSLLRRASTIGLMGYKLKEKIAESLAKKASPKRAASPAKALKTPSPAKALKTPSPAKALKTPSPAKALKTPSPAKALKTPSPAKASPSLKAKTPSPKNPKTPSPSSNPSTPKFSRMRSNASAKSLSPSQESLLKTPTTHGRFSVSRISTPSPVPDQEKETKEESVHGVKESQERVTPRATPRRKSMKASARKTPKSVLKSALDVVRSRRSGASRANLKVVSSWADIVKFGQIKPQTEGGTKKVITKKAAAVKQSKVTKPKTPAHRLKESTSTGHADSPASIVVGKAYLRSTQLVGAAPKVVCNVALFKKDMKMDEDLTGVSDIFKTPANNRRKSAYTKANECPVTPHGVNEMSVMNTPEESGEMVVSPISIASTAKLGRYNNEAVTRLLQDDQDGSLIEAMDTSAALSQSEVSMVLDMPSEDQTLKNKNSGPVQTPRHRPTPPECLTGVKRLLRTPKQKAEPVEDLWGKLLKTPKAPKLSQEESLEGVKELLSTPKQKESPLEKGRAGIKRSITSPEVTNSPVVCSVSLKRLDQIPNDMAEQEEDLTGVKRLMKTPKLKNQLVEDLTGVKRMMKTPKLRNQPVEEDLTGVKELMKTPMLKNQPVEDLPEVKQMMKTSRQKKQPVEENLTGVKQMMKTPKLKNHPVEEDLSGVRHLVKTPKQNKQPVEEDLSGVRHLMKTPKQKKQPVEEDLSGVRHLMKTPKQKKQLVEEDLTGVKQLMKTPKQKKQPVEEDLTGVQHLMKTPRQKNQPVDDDFGIDSLMKTPRQKRDGAVLASTIVAELGVASSAVLPVRGAKEESEEKENIWPGEDMTNAKAAVGLQIETEEAVTSCPELQKASLKTTSAAVEATISVASPKHEQKTTLPAKKSRRGVRTAQKSQKNQHEVDSDSLFAGTEDETSAESAKSAPSIRGRRGKSAVKLIQDVSIQSPARKSSRGKIIKEQVEALQSAAEDEQVVLKPGRGRKAEQEVEVMQVGSVNDLKAFVEMEYLKSPAPARAKRGKKEKPELETPQEPEALPEVSGEEAGVASEKAELQPSAESEVVSVKSNTRARRGRTTRKEPTQSSEVEESPDVVAEVEGAALESAKAENDDSLRKTRRGRPTKKESSKPSLTAVESEVKRSDAMVELAVEAEPRLPENAEVHSATETEDLVKANSKPRRGKATKKETAVTAQVEEMSKSASEVLPEEHLQVPVVKSRRGRKVNPVDLNNQALADESSVETCVEPQPKPEAPPVRSNRGARNKQMKLQVKGAADGPATETVATSTVTEEPAEEPVVKTVRGVGRTKQPKVQVEDKTSIESETIQHSEAPAARSARGKHIAVVKDDPEPPVKRGRRGATVEIPLPVVKPTRGRKAVVKLEPEGVSEDATAVAEPVEEPCTKTKVQGSTVEEAPLVQGDSDMVDVSSEVVAKRQRGRIAKKAKVSFKDTATEAAEEELSNKKEEKPAAKNYDPSDVETKRSEHPLVKGRKGRGAKKTEEPEKEMPAPEENIQSARRGRTGVPQHDKVATSQKRGQKRKEMEIVAEETSDTESLPKRKRGKGAGTEAQAGAATPGRGRRMGAKAQVEAVEEPPKKDEKPPKKDEKPVRGRRKTTEEDVPAQIEEPVSEVIARRGTRGQKKAETDVPLAPVRRTRRK